MRNPQDTINRAVRSLKRCGPFHYRPGDEVNRLDCMLAGRVNQVFRVGTAASREMCREAGEDPGYLEPQAPQCGNCMNDATCAGNKGHYWCDDCCNHDTLPATCSPLSVFGHVNSQSPIEESPHNA